MLVTLISEINPTISPNVRSVKNRPCFVCEQNTTNVQLHVRLSPLKPQIPVKGHERRQCQFSDGEKCVACLFGFLTSLVDNNLEYVAVTVGGPKIGSFLPWRRNPEELSNRVSVKTCRAVPLALSLTMTDLSSSLRTFSHSIVRREEILY